VARLKLDSRTQVHRPQWIDRKPAIISDQHGDADH
jgi:hypothetical protein